jgi:protocatechuate 3,4-dioxygenase beta subunit
MSWVKNCILCILVLLLAAVSMPKTCAATIKWNETWTALTSDGKPASGAVVRIYRSTNSFFDSTVTITKTVADANGVFTLTYPNEGEDRWRQGHDEAIFVSKGNESEYIGTNDDKYSKTKVVSLLPTVSHKLHVVDSNDKPVVGVPIFINGIQTNHYFMTWGDQQGEPWCVKTDANGDVTFPLIPKTSYSDFGVGGDKYAAVNYLGQRGIMERPAVETLHVAIGGSANGVVMSEAAGAPTHTNVRAYRKEDNDGNNRYQYIQTDTNGSFTFKKLAPGTYTIFLEFEPADAKSWAAPARTGVQIVSGKAVSDVNFMLTHGAIIKGVVREKGTNKPVNNNPNYRVNLTFYGPAAPQGESNGVNVQLQQDGSYQICVAPGDQTVNIYDQDAAPESRYRTETIHVASGETKEFNIDLEPAPKKMIVHGKVLSAEGTPVSGASLYILLGRYETETQTTDANGVFTINNADTGSLVAASTKNATTAGYATLTADSDKSDLVLTLSEKPAPMATGKVVDSSGKPIEGATVRAPFMRPGAENNFTNFDYLTAITNKNGEYSIGPLFAGSQYTINAEAAGYANGSAPLQEALPHKDIAFEQITLALKNSHIHGQIINLSEQPIAGATVAEYGQYQPTNTVITDKNGYFTLGNLTQGECYLKITAPGYDKDERVQTKTGIDNAEFSLAKADPSAITIDSVRLPTGDATLTGKVVDEQGKPLTGKSVSMTCTVKFNDDFAYLYIPAVKSDENGQYQFKNLAKGAHYTVYYSQDRGVEQKDAVSYFEVGNNQEINSLEEAQVAKDIVLKVRDSFVAGKVVDPQGNPVKSANINITQSKSTDWAQTDEKGEFRFKVLSKGDVAILANDEKATNIAMLVAQPGADNLVLKFAPLKYHGDGANARTIVKAAKAKAISEGKALLIDLYLSRSPELRALFDDKEAKPVIDKYFEVAHVDLYDVDANCTNIDAVFYELLYKSMFIGISRSGKASVIDNTDAQNVRQALPDPASASNIVLKVLRQTEPKITDAEASILLGAIKRVVTQYAQ